MKELTTDSPAVLRSDLLKLALVAGCLFFVALGARDLWNPNEPIYGRAVAEMAQRGDWLIPTVNDTVFAEKPILYFWSALVTSKLLGGVSELSLRVPSAIAGLGSVLLTYLLILPYIGRRQALVTAGAFMTLYQVFWASRAVQMDSLVLASTLGVLVPLTRFLDFQARPGRAFMLAGLAAGLGFTAKGPVTLVIPGLILFTYAITTGRLRQLFHRKAWMGVALAVLVSSPWYLLLSINGEAEFLKEVLFRQNVTRFLQAWDHHQPWWYFLKYIWIDYAPWSLLLPAAALIKGKSDSETRLSRLSWIWIIVTIGFFSLSESKRAPYILPVAPAVAALAAGVLDRWIFGHRLLSSARFAATLAFSLLAALLLAVGSFVLTPWAEVPRELGTLANFLGIFLIAFGLALAYQSFRSYWNAPSNEVNFSMIGCLVGGVGGLYLLAATWALPAADPMKSARGFSQEMNRCLEATQGTVAAFRFWNFRSGCSYYGNRSIHSLNSPTELMHYWEGDGAAHILVESRNLEEVITLLPQSQIASQGLIGNRQVTLLARRLQSHAPQERRPISSSIIADQAISNGALERSFEVEPETPSNLARITSLSIGTQMPPASLSTSIPTIAP